MKRIFIISVITFLIGVFLMSCKSPAPEPSQEEPVQKADTTPNVDIPQMYEEIVKLRERIFSDTEIKVQNAKTNLMELVDARQNLAEARINLANQQNRDDLVLQELQSLIQFYIQTRGKLIEQLDSGQGLTKDLYELEIALIQANIRQSEILLKIKGQLTP